MAEGYIQRAGRARNSASLQQLDPHDRFIVAYEGLFSLAMGVLALYGLRPGDGEGHRAIALQAVLAVLRLDPGEMQRIIRLHDLRNAKVYRSPLPASEADASDALEALDVMLAKAKPVARSAPHRESTRKRR